jgi:hypothetical protein
MRNWIRNLRRLVQGAKPNRRRAPRRPALEGLETRCLLAAPVITGLSLSSTLLSEGQGLSLSGSFTDADAGQTYTLIISWGEGEAGDSIDLGTATSFGPITHTYADDNPTGTPADEHRVNILLIDSGNETATGEAGVVIVSNENPTVGALAVTPVGGAGNTVTLNATFTDPGLLDNHSVTIDWGDGSEPISFGLDTGVRVIGPISHTYLDDAPSPDDRYTVTLTVADDDGGQGIATTTVAVPNVAPALTAADLSLSADLLTEGDTVRLTGTFTDPEVLDEHIVVINWGDGSSDTLTLEVGARSFEATHLYVDVNPLLTPSDDFTIAVMVIDDDGGTGSATTALTVVNAAPVLTSADLSLSATTISEGQTVTLTGEFSDPGTLDSHTVVISWGDGTSTPLTLASGITTFSATHLYLDVLAPGTPMADLPITVTVSDNEGGSASAATAVTLLNVESTITIGGLSLSADTINEGGSVTLSGSFTDSASTGLHTVRISWGDGSPDSVLTLGAGELSFSAPHLYRDDNPTGTPEDVNLITVTITGEAPGLTSATTSVTVRNVAPVLTSVTVSPSVSNENETNVHIIVFVSDPGVNDSHIVTIDWGDGSPVQTIELPANILGGPEPRKLEVGHRYLDDRPGALSPDVYTIRFALADDDEPEAPARFSTDVTVNNVAPLFSASDLTLSATTVQEGEVLTLAGVFTDPGILDNHTVVIDWGDGSSDTLALPAGENTLIKTFSATHVYAGVVPEGSSSVVQDILVTVSDNGGGSTSAATSVAVGTAAPPLTITGLSLDVDAINEGGEVVLSGAFTDPAAPGGHTVVISWGDGSADTLIELPAGVLEFSAVHQYRDDNPTGTAADVNTITATVTGLTSATATTTVTVANVAPSLDSVTAFANSETLIAVLSGTFTDSLLDALTLAIDWQDGSPLETVALAAGTTSFSVTHQYPAETALEGATINLTLSDDDGGSTEANPSLTVVPNLTPIANAGPDQQVAVGSEVTLTGTFTEFDPLDTHTFRWTVVGPAGQRLEGTEQTIRFTPEAGGNYAGIFVVTDDKGNSATDLVVITASDSGPVEAPTLTLSGPAAVAVGASYFLTLTATGSGTESISSWTINWGDGIIQTIDGNPSSVPHVYSGAGAYTIQASATNATGTHAAANVLSVSVLATGSGVLVSGADTAEPGTPYTVTLPAAITGKAPILSWTIIWGDGASDTVVGGQTTVTHTYGLVSASYTILATAAHEDGATTAADPLNVAVEFANPSRAFVAQVYLDLLGRVADAGGLDYWSLLVDQGQPRPLVVMEIQRSLEYRTKVVEGLYTSLLGRSSDPDGLAYYTQALASGSTRQQLMRNFLASEEYYQNRGGGTDAGFLAALANDVFGPSAPPVVAPKELASVLDRANLALDVLNSQQGLEALVQSFYFQYLRRPADDGGLNYWVRDVLQTGVSEDIVIAHIIGSDEYFARL